MTTEKRRLPMLLEVGKAIKMMRSLSGWSRVCCMDRDGVA